jgi:hypothetical protein
MNMIEAPYEEEGSSFCGGPITSPPLKLKEKQNYSESLLVIIIDWHNGTRLLVSSSPYKRIMVPCSCVHDKYLPLNETCILDRRKLCFLSFSPLLRLESLVPGIGSEGSRSYNH